MLVSSAVRIIAITLKTLILYATVSYAGDMLYPGPVDGYSSILPPLMGQTTSETTEKTEYVIQTFTECERVSMQSGQVDATTFKTCFEEHKTQNPTAFDFLDDGFDFIMFMVALFFLYYYAISPRIDKMLGKDGNEFFDSATPMGQIFKTAATAPMKITDKVADVISKK